MDPTNANTALASALVEELARCGVARAVVSPGSRSTPLALALWRQPAIAVSVLVDERSAGFFALGAAGATRRPVAVACTSGTAAANLHPAVSEADEASVPLLVLTSDRPPELRGIGAGQTIDQVKLYGGAARWFCEVGTHEADDDGLLHMRSTACRAFAAAQGDPRPGPVHLNLSWREPLAPEPREGAVTARSTLALEGRGDEPLTRVPRAAAPLDAKAVASLAAEIGGNARGMIVAGRQGDPELAAPVASLARASGYPILAEPTSQLRCGAHDRGLVVSAYDAIARVRPAELEPETVIRFGDMPTSKALRGWLASLESATQLVVDPTGGWNEPTRRAARVVRADPRAFAREVAAAIGRPSRGKSDFAAVWSTASRAATEAVAQALAGEAELSEPALQLALGEVLEDGELVYTASSMPIRDQEAFLGSSGESVLFLSNRGANGIDGTVSSGIGAAAATGRPTWVVLGDLALLHDSNGLTALREASAPVRVLVIENGGGAIFDFLPQAGLMPADEFEALLGTPPLLDIAALAAAHGVPHHRLERLADLRELGGRGSGVIEVSVDRSANVALHERLATVAAEAIEAAAR